MYFVDMNSLIHKLNFFDNKLKLYHQVKMDTEVDKLGLERLTHVLIESFLDIGNMMIDGFVMRDPGSYADIITILVDENVLKKEDEEAYQALINIRKDLVSNYENVDHQSIQHILDKYFQVFEQFSKDIKSYLATEMGVANTFTE
ncbi:DUF86 domain-containing protein [Gracilibacillus oryzae]|uniref:DUF86 domain-containing protein n=1 Tax=Gracilibacillus oryzae TaxID=1672701 RepID=A0A7C8KRD5_9BACI|nr:DUF86 domain-containing protein [Gracilibacillus oryzae]KAB8131793.1 DUF86 domain-containing protein [Gracilibacillus oryzae]